MRDKKDNILNKLLSWFCIPQKGQQLFIIRLVIFWIAMTAVIVIDPDQVMTELEVGKPAPKTIICLKNITITDKNETELLRNKARNSEPSVFEFKPMANEQIIEEFDKNMVRLTAFYEAFKASTTPSTAAIFTKEYFKDGFFLSDVRLSQILNLSEAHFENLKSVVRKNLVDICKLTIAEQTISEVKKEIVTTANKLWDEELILKQIFIEVMEASIRTNSYLNEAQTIRNKEEAANRIQPAMKVYQKGQRIVTAGDIVTEDINVICKEIRHQLKRNVFLSILGSLLLLALFISIGLTYIRVQDVNVFVDDAQYKLIASLSFALLLATKLVYGISIDFDKEYLLLLLSPMATYILLLTSTMSNIRIVYFCVFWMGLLSFLVTEGDHSFLVALLIGSIGGILSWNLSFNDNESNMRSTIHGTGLNVGVATFIAVMSVLLIDIENDDYIAGFSTLFGYSVCGFINGLASGIVANGLIPYVEKFYSFATPTRLLELSSTESPLLKRLAEEAPGTYQHSLAVANMAAQAASAVDADALLTKVCALYHDIGKLKRPEYYTENQNGENPHDEKKPTMSALIIATHIKDSVEMARDANIPHRVIEVMSQHHGTTLIEYFYNKQKELTPDSVDESQFRYKSLKPQCKEAAILLLADAVEASTRSLDDLNPEKIKAHVKRIVDHKIKDDNQLEETNLTLKDIDTIEDEFVKVLLAANHKRIKYQNQLREEAAAKAAAKAAESSAALTETSDETSSEDKKED